MVRNIRHTGIVVEDLEASLSFYQDILGFRISRQMEESGEFIDSILAMDGTVITTVKMAAPDGQLIELLKFHSNPRSANPRGLCDIGITHIAFTVDDMDREYERLKANGIRFLSPPRTSPDGFATVAFCRAPEGTYIEMVEEHDE